MVQSFKMWFQNTVLYCHCEYRLLTMTDHIFSWLVIIFSIAFSWDLWPWFHLPYTVHSKNVMSSSHTVHCNPQRMWRNDRVTKFHLYFIASSKRVEMLRNTSCKCLELCFMYFYCELSLCVGNVRLFLITMQVQKWKEGDIVGGEKNCQFFTVQ